MKSLISPIFLKRSLRAHVLSRFSCVQLFATPWTIAYQVSLSMGFSRQEYWSGLPFPPPRDLPNPGIKPESPVAPALQAHSSPLSHQGSSKRSLVLPILLFSFISLHCSFKKAFLSLLAIFWNSAYRWVYVSLSLLPFTSLLTYF